VQNMLGRAGRAGYVSDGICLIAIRESPMRENTILERYKQRFFNTNESVGFVGLKNLITKCKDIDIGHEEWFLELDGLELSESFSLLRLAASFEEESPDGYANLVESLYEYPSVKELGADDV